MSSGPDDPGTDLPDVPDTVPTSWVDDDTSLPQDAVLGAVLVAPVAGAVALAQVCVLADVQGVVVPVRGNGCAVVPHDPQAAAVAAQALSRALGGAELLVLTRSGPRGGSGTSGRLEAERWKDGARHEAPTPGVLLATLPDVLERLALGLGDPAAAEGAVDTRSVGRGEAAKGLLGGLFRRRRDEQAGPS